MTDTCRWCMAEDEWHHTDGCPKLGIQERDALIEALEKVVRRQAEEIRAGSAEIHHAPKPRVTASAPACSQSSCPKCSDWTHCGKWTALARKVSDGTD